MAKTRVVAHYATQWGRDIFYVERFCDFDTIMDGKKMVSSTTGLYWRRVQTFATSDGAVTFARNLSLAPDEVSTERVTCNFEDGKEKLDG
jgi:hypothetical protein